MNNKEIWNKHKKDTWSAPPSTPPNSGGTSMHDPIDATWSLPGFAIWDFWPMKLLQMNSNLSKFPSNFPSDDFLTFDPSPAHSFNDSMVSKSWIASNHNRILSWEVGRFCAQMCYKWIDFNSFNHAEVKFHWKIQKTFPEIPHEPDPQRLLLLQFQRECEKCFWFWFLTGESCEKYFTINFWKNRHLLFPRGSYGCPRHLSGSESFSFITI